MRKEPDPSKSLCLFQLPSFPSEPPAADRRNKKIARRRDGEGRGDRDDADDTAAMTRDSVLIFPAEACSLFLVPRSSHSFDDRTIYRTSRHSSSDSNVLPR